MEPLYKSCVWLHLPLQPEELHREGRDKLQPSSPQSQWCLVLLVVLVELRAPAETAAQEAQGWSLVAAGQVVVRAFRDLVRARVARVGVAW